MRISLDSRSKALMAATAASDKKATDIVILDMGPLIGITDYFVICSAPNTRQVKTIADEVKERLGASEIKPYRREGERENRWVLLDYLDIVVHIFHEEEREFYRIENLWQDADRLPFEEATRAFGS
ncbi:MAG: ribosome silencing factor [Actinomycetota bacterium]|nr:ribosome silencing factor [Actinomycetota bacterium]